MMPSDGSSQAGPVLREARGVGPPSADIGIRTPAALPKPHRRCRWLGMATASRSALWCQIPSWSHGHPGPCWFSLTQTPPQMRSLHTSSHLELHFSEDTEHPSALRTVRTPVAACLRAQLHTSSQECPATRARRTWQSLRAGIFSPRGLCCTHPCESPLLPRAGHSERGVVSASFAPSGGGWGSWNLSLACTPHSRTASSQGHCGNKWGGIKSLGEAQPMGAPVLSQVLT